MYGNWYALTIYKVGDTKHVKGRRQNTWPSKVFKSEAMAKLVQCKTAPYLHSILVGEYHKYNKTNTKQKVPAFIVTYVWDTRQIVDVQQIDNDKQIDAILNAGKDNNMLAPDNHSPLKGIEKVQAAYAKAIEYNRLLADDEYEQPKSLMINAVLQALGKGVKSSDNKSPDAKSIEKAKSVEVVTLQYDNDKAKVTDRSTYTVTSVNTDSDYKQGDPKGYRGWIDVKCTTANGETTNIYVMTKHGHVTNWFGGTIIKSDVHIDGMIHAYTFK